MKYLYSVIEGPRLLPFSPSGRERGVRGVSVGLLETKTIPAQRRIKMIIDEKKALAAQFFHPKSAYPTLNRAAKAIINVVRYKERLH